MAVEIKAEQVKILRERTGLGMMECKKALQAAGGNMDVAVEELRKSGRAKADKKAGRITAEGGEFIEASQDGRSALMLEVNSETDFVARDTHFTEFAAAVAGAALAAKCVDIEALSALPLAKYEGASVGEVRQSLVAKLGENIHLRRAAFIHTASGSIGTYLHGGRIGVLVELDVDLPDLAKDIAMHIAASKPLVIAQEDVPEDLVLKEKEIYMAQAATSGKPQDILEKMVGGKLKKYLDEVSLLGQPFVKDPEVTVSSLLGKNRAKVVSFVRFEVGEGIEKETEDFVEAVMAQVQQSE